MKKIPTIFMRNKENMKLVTSEINPICKWVFDGEGIATRKYDGTCCKIENGNFFKRRELRNGDNIPENFVQEDFDKITGKTFGWVPVDKSDKSNIWHIEAFNDCLQDGTYELVGPKIQGNPEKISQHTLINHAEAEKLYPPRAFEELAEWLKNEDIEGIVFHHPDGRMAKIKKRDFGLSR